MKRVNFTKVVFNYLASEHCSRAKH